MLTESSPHLVTIEFIKKLIRFGLCGLFLLGLLLVNGCDKRTAMTERPVALQDEAAGSPDSAPAKPDSPGEGEKLCFACEGNGTMPCLIAGCAKGQMDCPGPCLKLSRGSWIRMNVAGHDPSELWQKFPNQSGRGGYKSWNHHHVGEVIQYQNGVAVNVGQCKICGGTTKVTCKTCSGTGNRTCEICEAKKFIPVAWTLTDNPWFNRQPDIIRLKDGRKFLGRVGRSAGNDRTIVTRDKQIVRVKSADILPKTPTNSPATANQP